VLFYHEDSSSLLQLDSRGQLAEERVEALRRIDAPDNIVQEVANDDLAVALLNAFLNEEINLQKVVRGDYLDLTGWVGHRAATDKSNPAYSARVIVGDLLWCCWSQNK